MFKITDSLQCSSVDCSPYAINNNIMLSILLASFLNSFSFLHTTCMSVGFGNGDHRNGELHSICTWD